jgi:acetylornithine deacetylase
MAAEVIGSGAGNDPPAARGDDPASPACHDPPMMDRIEAAALGAIDAEALARDLSAAVHVPSVTGDERGVLELIGGLAQRYGLDAELHEHDLAALRRHPGHPGEEAPRSELVGLTATLPGRAGRRLCLNGHVDVVGPGTEAWRHGPWSGVIADGLVHGRGSVDMKGGVVAALHALAAIRAAGGAGHAPEVVLQCVASEEDGGLGTFGALERDAAFDACLIPEPTGFQTVCAQAGALTFRGIVGGTAAHGAVRLAGRSAIDRYMAIHRALHEHERALNADVAHPAMRALELPYPISVGRLEAGQWSAQVPDRLVFEGRLGVRMEDSLADARAAFEQAVRAADGERPPVEIEWTRGSMAPGETSPDHPWVRLVRASAEEELGRESPFAGVPYGADMRLFCARGIPCVMLGPSGLELAHAVDERVRVDELAALARTIVRALLRSPAVS